MAVIIPERLIETINKLVRTSRQLLLDLGREPTPRGDCRESGYAA